MKKSGILSSSPFLPLSTYMFSFLLILFLWALLGSSLTLILQRLLIRTGTGSSPFALYALQHANFILLLAMELLFIRYIEKKRFLSFISDDPYALKKNMLTGITVWFVLILLYTLSEVILRDNALIPQWRGPGTHLIMVLLALALTPVQILAEEILFRGFFYRGFSRTAVNRHLVSAISGITFTAAHIMNLELGIGESPVLVLLYYFLSGFLFMELTYSFRGIAVVAGAHFINNFFISVGVNYQNSSIISYPLFYTTRSDIYLDLVMLLTSSLILLRIAEKRKSKDMIE